MFIDSPVSGGPDYLSSTARTGNQTVSMQMAFKGTANEMEGATNGGDWLPLVALVVFGYLIWKGGR